MISGGTVNEIALRRSPSRPGAGFAKTSTEPKAMRMNKLEREGMIARILMLG